MKISRILFLLLIATFSITACQQKSTEQPFPTTQQSEPAETPAPTLMAMLATLEAQSAGGDADKDASPTLSALLATIEAQPTQDNPSPTVTTQITPIVPIPTIASDSDLPGQAWWEDAVFYEIFVRSFYDSDGDGVGDIQGIIEKLDYLNDGDPATEDDLGITGIWLMPITESPSYHGYDVVDYYTVDQEYGTPEDFQRLMVEAHQRGIRVIVDLVLNHTSSQHPWFQQSRAGESAYRDWYIWDSNPPDFLGPWGQTVWNRSGDSYYYALFWGGMPDLNLENPAVTEEINAITRFWLQNMGVDGFRLDAVKHFVEDGPVQENTPATHAWLGDFNTFYKSVNANAFTVGEAWTATSQVVDYTGDEVDIAFAFDLAEDIIDTARGPLAVPVVERMQEMVASFPPGQYGTFLANHDQNRLNSQLNGDEAKVKLASTILLTSPGTPFLYYGEEIGMMGIKPDEDIRRPMQWHGDDLGVGFTSGRAWRLPALDYQTRHVASQIDDPDSLLYHYRSLIHLRNDHQALSTGDWTLVETNSARLYAFLRHTEDQVILVLVNVHPQALTTENYELSLDSGPLTTGVNAVSLFGLENPALPVINSQGGFDTYIPFDLIPPQSFAIILLQP
ncbi:MAG: alpha-amylase family glycosyl hydrolase [Chloroflexota bacterium]